MLAVTRETLIGYLLEVPRLADLAQRRDPAYPDQVVAWLARAEEGLGRLRSPLVSLAAAQRSAIQAAAEAPRDAESGRSLSPRKARRSAASRALSLVEAALRQAVQEIDAQLNEAREKMVQLLAVAASEQPVSLSGSGDARLTRLWTELAESKASRTLHAYLSTALRPSDRLYLLADLIANIEGSAAESVRDN